MFPNNAERNKIMVNVRFGKGYSGLSSRQETLAWSGAMALMASGVGDLGQEELDKITTGRRIGLGFGIDNDAFEISADTRPTDLEDQLHLIAAKLAFPRWDAAPVIRSKAASPDQLRQLLGLAAGGHGARSGMACSRQGPSLEDSRQGRF